MQKPKRRSKKVRRQKKAVQYGFLLGLLVLASFIFFNRESLFAYKVEFDLREATEKPLEEESEKPTKVLGSRKNHVETPESVKAIYMTSCVVSTPSFRERLVGIIDRTEINSVVIDVKDYTGTLSFIPQSEELKPLWEDGRCGTSEMESFIEELHERGVYVIARITVFQDPYYAPKHPDQAVQSASTGGVWRDGKGLSFIDVSAKPAWDHTIEIAKEAYAIGFDELNFDYIRFPSDGNMQDTYFPYTKNRNKADALEAFFSYLDETLDKEIPDAVTSADLFGMTTTNYDDLGIGQVLEKALPYFDYVAPMVYPSHYPAGFNGWSDPNSVPGPLIKFVMDSAVRRTVADTTPIQTLGSELIECTVEETSEEATIEEGETSTIEEKPLPPECLEDLYTKEVFDLDKIRPWLQDFDYGGNYDAAAVRAQIQSTYDAGLDSWMLWDPGNVYTESALLSE